MFLTLKNFIPDNSDNNNSNNNNTSGLLVCVVYAAAGLNFSMTAYDAGITTRVL